MAEEWHEPSAISTSDLRFLVCKEKCRQWSHSVDPSTAALACSAPRQRTQEVWLLSCGSFLSHPAHLWDPRNAERERKKLSEHKARTATQLSHRLAVSQQQEMAG